MEKIRLKMNFKKKLMDYKYKIMNSLNYRFKTIFKIVEYGFVFT
jgi:hypothetical protein